MDNAEYLEAYRKLSNAQRKYILDRTYISTNPNTEKVLVREGYVIPYKNRERSYNKNNCLDLGTKFTEKTNKMVKYRCELIRQKQKEDFPDHIVIENDQHLLEIFQEIILLGQEECDIYCHRGVNGFLHSNDVDYIIHPYYKWKIEIDKACGKFLKYESVTGTKGSYCYVYYNKGEKYV